MTPRSPTARLGIAGTGWAGRVHALAAASCHAELTCVADHTVSAATELAEALGVEATDASSLPGTADAVVIATPPQVHADLAIRLLTAGTPVLVEAPIASTPAEADAIIEAAEVSGTAACYAEHLLFAPAVELAVARRAAMGPLEHLEVRLSQPSPTGDDPARFVAGGVAFELGVHAVALATLLAHGDEPVAVRARLDSARADGADDVGRIELRFASDLIAAIDVSWSGETPEWSAQAASATGVVRVELQPHLTVDVDGEPVALPRTESEVDRRVTDLGFHAQLDGFRSVVARRGGRVCPAGFGRSMLEIVCAAYASAGADGEEVAVPFTGPRDRTPHQLWRS